jgi:hypothetical protein
VLAIGAGVGEELMFRGFLRRAADVSYRLRPRSRSRLPDLLRAMSIKDL